MKTKAHVLTLLAGALLLTACASDGGWWWHHHHDHDHDHGGEHIVGAQTQTQPGGPTVPGVAGQ